MIVYNIDYSKNEKQLDKFQFVKQMRWRGSTQRFPLRKDAFLDGERR